MINKSEKNYSPNQILANEQIDYLAMPGQTMIGATIAQELYLESVDGALKSFERDYLQSLDCMVDIGKAVVADLEGE